MDLRDREHFRVHSDRGAAGVFMSKPLVGRASGQWSIQLTRRIDRRDGGFGGEGGGDLDRSVLFHGVYKVVDVGQDGVVRTRRSAS